MCVKNIELFMQNIHTPNGRTFPMCDCWGLVCYVFLKNLGIKLDHKTCYDKHTMTNGYNDLVSDFEQVKTPKDYDVICYFKHDTLIHIGIYIDGHILHTDARKGTCFESFKPQNFIKIYRYKGIKNESENI